MEKRMRPVTYAESLEAKRYAEENNVKMVEEEKQKAIPTKRPTSVNQLNIIDLPSGGVSYPSESVVYFSPLTFGEMKFLAVSTLADTETIDFFLTKIHTSFDKEDLTYFDFYYITTMVKLSTFGTLEYTMSYECSSCGALNKEPFSLDDLLFEEISVPLPITVDLESPFLYENGEETSEVSFTPMTIGRFKKMIFDGNREDLDVYMSNCIIGGSEKDRLTIIKEVLNGLNVNLLETIDVSLFHGVQDLRFSCSARINKSGDKPDGEVCGRLHDIPFPDIIEYIGSTDKSKDSLRKRINFGIQNAHKP